MLHNLRLINCKSEVRAHLTGVVISIVHSNAALNERMTIPCHCFVSCINPPSGSQRRTSEPPPKPIIGHRTLTTDGPLSGGPVSNSLIVTPTPLILREQHRIDLDLLSQIRHSLLRHLGAILREPAINLEKFGQRGEPNRVTSGLLPINSQSGAINVQNAISSSGSTHGA